MTDWSQVPVPTHINSFMYATAAQELRAMALIAGGGASGAWPAANQAIFVPLRLHYPYLVRRVFWGNGSSVTGNMDVGVYSVGGQRLFSNGGTGQSGASALQYATLTTPYLLQPGSYYLAHSCDGTTNKSWGVTNVTAALGRAAGLLQMATAYVLPATATFAAWNSAWYPFFGICNVASGF